MIQCTLIDDEPLAISLMEDFIRKVPFLQLDATFNEPMAALAYLNEHDTDLIFLDIRMPDISGIDFFRTLAVRPEVIFITAFSDFALEGFELNAVDYLLKPVSFERFLLAANRAKNAIEGKKHRQPGKDYFFINASYKIHKLFYKDILYLEGDKDYTKIFLAGVVSPLLVLHNLKYFEDLLREQDFIRVHRSFIVPVNKINTISKKIINIHNKSIPVSNNYRDKLYSYIKTE